MITGGPHLGLAPLPPSQASDQSVLQFGPFRLEVEGRALFENGKQKRLGGRAMDLLIILATNPGELLTKEQLFAHVWPNINVEESSLRVHIAALRRVLRDGQDGLRYIATVSGRGYCFTTSVGPAREHVPAGDAARDRPEVQLPSRLTRTIGRNETVHSIAGQLRSCRLLTIVGFGGVGKTTVAISVAELMAGWYPDGIYFVDLGTVADGNRVLTTIGSSMGLSLPVDHQMDALARFLSGRRVLLVLDNCEHLVACIASMAEEILKSAPDVHILATSREALRAEGERVQHLQPLEFPPPFLRIDAESALGYSAIELFVEHASASQDTFQLTDADAEVVGEICRRLDGIPLAIELAANRIDMFGIRGLAGRLNDRFMLLTHGRRTALPRHRTLSAMLDWSYELLSPPHRAVFRRLALLRSSFPLETALAIAKDCDLTDEDIMDAVMVLSAGSLVSTDVSDDCAYYSLLGMTRTYAQAKLEEEEADLDRLRHVHALHLLDLFRIAEQEWLTEDRSIWLRKYSRRLDDVRAALDWTLREGGDPALGVALTAAWVPLGFALSLMEEFRERVELALGWMDRLQLNDPVVEQQLLSAFNGLSGQTSGDSPQIQAGYVRALELAEMSGSVETKHEALLGMWVAAYGAGDYATAGKYARALRESAAEHSDPIGSLTGDRMHAQILHFLGDHAQAREVAAEVMARPGKLRAGMKNPVQVDRRVSMRIIISRAMWLQGEVDAAVEVAEACLDYALQDVPHAVCQALGMSVIPVALWRGDFPRAVELSARLIEHACRYTMEYWREWGLSYDAIAKTRLEGEDAVISLVDVPSNADKLSDHLITCTASALTPRLLERVRSGTVAWCGPEAFRAEAARLHRKRTGAGTGPACDMLQAARLMAAQQGAVSWELRSAIDLARIAPRAERAEYLSSVERLLGKIKGGAATQDVLSAHRLLDEANG